MRQSVRRTRPIQSSSEYGLLYAQLGRSDTVPSYREPDNNNSCYGLYDGAFGLASENLHDQDHNQKQPNDGRDTNIIPHGVKRASSQCRESPEGACSGERQYDKQVKTLRCCEGISRKEVHGANSPSS